MSSSAVQQVIRRAVSDASFRQQLQSNPTSALRGFDLTADESAAISSRDPGRLAAFGVDQRISKAFTIGGAALNSDPMTDVPNSTGGVTRLDMDPGDASRLAIHDSGSAAPGATNSVDSGIIGSGSTNSLDSGSAASGATDVLDSGSAGSGATNAFDSGSAASGAAPAWHDDAQPTIAASTAPSWRDDAQPVAAAESGSPAWRDDAQPTAADSSATTWRDDAQPLAANDAALGSSSAVHDVAPADLSLSASDDAPLASLSAVHDVAPTDLGSDSSISAVHDVAPVDLSSESISVDGDVDTGHSEILHPDTPQ